MRIFIGIPVPETVRQELVRIQMLLKKENLFFGTYVAPENLHTTLLFLGSKTEEEITIISDKLSALSMAPFLVQLGTVEVPHWSSARLIWVTLIADQLPIMHSHLVSLVPGHDDKRSFTGHCTIARIKSITNKQALKEYLTSLTLQPLSWKVDSFNLYASQTFQEGPEYSIIRTYNLKH